MGNACTKDQFKEPKLPSALQPSFPQSFSIPTISNQANQINIKSFTLQTKTKILMSAYHGQFDTVVNYVKQGFNINQELNQTGWRLMHIAAQKGDIQFLRILLDLQADPDLQDRNQQWTPLMVASINNKLEVVKILLQVGANVNIRSFTNSRAIDLAKEYHSMSIYQYLKSYM